MRPIPNLVTSPEAHRQILMRYGPIPSLNPRRWHELVLTAVIPAIRRENGRFYVYEQDYPRIAELLGCDPKTVSSNAA